jgi:TRAP-type C4-dicarboxylate transport system permease small subunit
MRRVLDLVYDGSLAGAGLFMVGIFVLMVGESVFRFLGSYITGANELIGWCCAAAGFLALPATFKRGDMVRAGFVVDRLPHDQRKAVLLLCLLVALVFVSYMVWAVGRYLWDGWRTEETTQGMIVIAVWVPQLSFLVGTVLLWVAVVDELVVKLQAPADRLRAEREAAVGQVTAH